MNYTQKITALVAFSLLFWLGWAGILSAQQYAQITRDFECKIRENGRKIQLFKGEIYEIYQDEAQAKLTIAKKGIILKINQITIEIPWGSGSKQTYTYPIKFDSIAFKAIQDKGFHFVTRSEKTGKYRFDISELTTNDTVFFASYRTKSVVKLLNTKSVEVDSSYFEKNYYGQIVRMIIPNYPTLGFDWDKIDFPLHENSDKNTQTENPEKLDTGNVNSTRNLILIIAILALLGIVLVVFRGRLFGGKEKKNVAKNTIKRHNELKRRRRAAEQSIPKPTTNQADSSEDEKPDINSDENTEIEQPITENNTNSHLEKDEMEFFSETELNLQDEPENPAENDIEQSEDLEEESIIIEREKPTYIPENQIIIKQTSPEDLEKIQILEAKLAALKTEKEALREELEETKTQILEVSAPSSENTILTIQGIAIGNYAYLCEWFKNYLEKAEHIETKVKEFHDRSVKEDAQTEKAVIEGILYKFYTAKNALSALEYWKFIIQELENTNGKIIENQLRAELEMIAESERVTHLQNRLFREVLAGYFGATLIMCEEMRHIDRFTNLKFLLAENISAHFAKESETLVQAFSGSSARRVNYVPLFEFYQANPEIKVAFMTAENYVCPAYYDEVKGENGEVIVIKTYGFGDTPSEILMA